MVEKCVQNFNPRSPHGERPRSAPGKLKLLCISIHAPRTGSDVSSPTVAVTIRRFQSTLPARGATFIACSAFASSLLFQSTLPARGATAVFMRFPPRNLHFNPRSPHGERRYGCHAVADCTLEFQSTLPARGATFGTADVTDTEKISIHAPRTGSD